MPNLTSVGITSGVPTSGTGTVSTIDALMATGLPISAELPAGTQYIGSVGGNTGYIDVTLVLDTAIYESGDVMAVTQVVTNAMRANDKCGVLQSVHVIDEDDQGQPFDLIFLSANNSIGTLNAAVSISDASARDSCGYVSIGTGDYIDLGGVRIATRTGLGLGVKPATGTRNLYVAAISRGTGTYTASGVKLRLTFGQD